MIDQKDFFLPKRLEQQVEGGWLLIVQKVYESEISRN